MQLSLYSTATQNYWRLGQCEFSGWWAHPTQKFALARPTCWYLKTLKFALPLTQNIKSVLPQTQNPNASQWNIGCFGSPTQNWPCTFHFFGVDFICVGPLFFPVGINA